MTTGMIAEARAWVSVLAKDDCTGEAAVVMRGLAAALERAEKQRDKVYETLADEVYGKERLRAENERLEDRVTTLEERLRHTADDFSARDVPASVPQAVRRDDP